MSTKKIPYLAKPLQEVQKMHRKDEKGGGGLGPGNENIWKNKTLQGKKTIINHLTSGEGLECPF